MKPADLSPTDAERHHEAWPAFEREMRGREYGREPLLSAWHFFKGGWTAHVARMQAAATDWWCNNG